VNENSEGPARPPESLRRELLAILFLYGVLMLLPAAIGWLFMPAGG
jgi:hypothetical protein